MARTTSLAVSLAMALSVAAVGLSAVTLYRIGNRAVPPTPSSQENPITPELERRFEELSLELEVMKEPCLHGRAPLPETLPAGDGMEERLARLEESVADLRETVAETEARAEALAEAARNGSTAGAPPSEKQVEEFRERVLDPDTKARDRILAMRQLARVEDGRTPETISAMKEIFEASTDEWTRTASVAMLEGLTGPGMEDWLVGLLKDDRYSSTRESAVDVLSHFTGSVQVKDALRDAARNDQNHDVRAEAQNALDKIAERERNRTR